jgi:hypothetical protein
MPIRYRISQKRRLVTVIFEGRTTAEDAAHWIRERQADPELSGLARLVLVSDRAATMSMSEIDNLAQVVNDFSPENDNRCAIVTFNEVHFGQARMYLSHRSKSSDELQLFRNIKEALNWLGVDSSPAVMEFELAIALS